MISISQKEVAQSVFRIILLHAEAQRLLKRASDLGLYDFVSTEEDSYGRETLLAVQKKFDKMTLVPPFQPLLQSIAAAISQGEETLRLAQSLAEWSTDLKFLKSSHRKDLEDLRTDLALFRADCSHELY